MHNGNIAEFNTLKRRLQTDLPDVPFNMVQGNTGTLTPSTIIFLVLNRCFSLLRLGMGIRVVLVESTTLNLSARLYAHLNFFSFRIVTHGLSRQKL
jgi:hypothetical protein